MTKKTKMLQADFEEYVASLERRHGRVSVPLKRRQPKIKRHASREQRIANRQSPNIVASMYRLEGKYTMLPLLPDGAETTREVGPGDAYNNEAGYRTGKDTSPGKVTKGDGNKTATPGRRYGAGYKKTGKYTKPSQPKIDIAKLAEQYKL